MRISSINSFSNYNAGTAKNQNFKGLWGKTSVQTEIDEVMCIPKINETRYYYPFKDENPRDVEKIIEERKKPEIIDNNGFPLYIVSDCRPGMRLPFSRQQYEAYMQLSQRPHDYNIEVIHSTVKDKYLDDKAGGRQKPAYNAVIDKQKVPRLYE